MTDRPVADQMAAVPDMLPVLSRGKHRNPRKGGCFMELASFLAGERWSDHPSCTHPLLAALARHVNDLTGSDARPRLAPLIPAVIGVTADDPRLDVRIALRCATVALPVVAEERQRILALGVLAAEELLAHLDGRPRDDVQPASARALAAAPGAEAWARGFRSQVAGSQLVSVKGFTRFTAPNVVRCAAEGIAQACVPDPEARLRELLATVVDDSRDFVGLAPTDVTAAPPQQWHDACRLVGTATLD